MTSRRWLKAVLAAGLAVCLGGEAAAQTTTGGTQPPVRPVNTPRPGMMGPGVVGTNLTPQQQAALRLLIIRHVAQTHGR
jgi:hypothetical protein